MKKMKRSSRMNDQAAGLIKTLLNLDRLLLMIGIAHIRITVSTSNEGVISSTRQKTTVSTPNEGTISVTR